MSSSTEISNLALSHLGISKPIANLETEKTAEAAACRTFYEITRQRVLRDNYWPFAKRVETLGLVQETPNDEWAYSYRYPSKALMIRKIMSGIRNDTAYSKTKYEIASDSTGKLIWTDLTPAVAIITYDVSDSSFFHPDFVMALSFLLAFYIGPRVQDGDPAGLRKQAFDAYRLEISRARASALNEEASDVSPESSFTLERYGFDAQNQFDSFRSNL